MKATDELQTKIADFYRASCPSRLDRRLAESWSRLVTFFPFWRKAGFREKLTPSESRLFIRRLEETRDFLNLYSANASISKEYLRMAVHLRNVAATRMHTYLRNGGKLSGELVYDICRFPSVFKYYNGCEFHFDYFTAHIASWKSDLAPLLERADNRVLEIGSYEGLSSVWIAQNLLHGSRASLTCADLFLDEYRETFQSNIFRGAKSSKVRVLTGASQGTLKTQPSASFDFIYVDGSHTVSAVTKDAAQARRLLKRGGYLVFDDYLPVTGNSSDFGVQKAVNAFLKSTGSCFDVVRSGYQVTLKKLH